jgi:hypothetical protein
MGQLREVSTRHLQARTRCRQYGGAAAEVSSTSFNSRSRNSHVLSNFLHKDKLRTAGGRLAESSYVARNGESLHGLVGSGHGVPFLITRRSQVRIPTVPLVFSVAKLSYPRVIRKAIAFGWWLFRSYAKCRNVLRRDGRIRNLSRLRARDVRRGPPLYPMTAF